MLRQTANECDYCQMISFFFSAIYHFKHLSLISRNFQLCGFFKSSSSVIDFIAVASFLCSWLHVITAELALVWTTTNESQDKKCDYTYKHFGCRVCCVSRSSLVSMTLTHLCFLTRMWLVHWAAPAKSSTNWKIRWKSICLKHINESGLATRITSSIILLWVW